MAYKNTPFKVLVFCTVEAGLDSVSLVLSKGYKVEAIVGLDPVGVDTDKVSGFVDISSFCIDNDIPYIFVNRYDLRDNADLKKIKELNFDIIWVSGWQRLIPTELISEAPLGAIGGHGSPDGIVDGRGRSPQNWALLLDAKRFEVSLFRITPSVDDGPIIATRTFEYTEHDTIAISQKKTSICMSEMVCELFETPSILNQAKPQPSSGFYYPQRYPEDGIVDWQMKRSDIIRHCRALTRPYPGLRTTHDNIELTIWSCVSFDDKILNKPGCVEQVFADGSFIVSCLDGRLLIKEYSCDNTYSPKQSDQLVGQDFTHTMEKIIVRHKERYPELPLAKRIIDAHK